LRALHDALGPEDELIVVDDDSQDETAALATRLGVRVLRLESNLGPAAARNHGAAHARGEILCFVDADVVVPANGLREFARHFALDPAINALFGSYDATPSAPGLVSQYRNLLHHYTHQHGRQRASTFWAGYGAIRTEAFFAVDGFDAHGPTRYGMEDIELGYRLRAAGYTIRLVPELQCTHLKAWTLWSMVRTDVLHRAIPWSRLILERGPMPKDLNLDPSRRLGVALTLVGGTTLSLSPFLPVLGFVGLGVWAAALWTNRDLFQFFVAARGRGFSIMTMPLQLLFFFYSGLSYLWVWLSLLSGRYAYLRDGSQGDASP
jgi:cellulose synthase/poly-beta-1,6-N-acetylglucosamine synthase-like glycosyltransferase